MCSWKKFQGWINLPPELINSKDKDKTKDTDREHGNTKSAISYDNVNRKDQSVYVERKIETSSKKQQDKSFYWNSMEQIADEYPQLKQCTAYLDHAGMTLPSKKLLDVSRDYLCNTLLMNPHTSESLSNQLISDTRQKILNLYGGDGVIFTMNASHAFQIIHSCVSRREYTPIIHEASHTSSIGLRGNKLGKIWNKKENLKSCLVDEANGALKLVVWPAQCNLDGWRPPSLEYIEVINEQKLNKSSDIIINVLDAASMLSTKAIKIPEGVDMMILSFHKIFGCPDLGCIVYRNSVLLENIMQTDYFGGGTIDGLNMNSATVWKKQRIEDRLEMGTLPFHSIATLNIAFDNQLEIYGSWDAISGHVNYIRSKCRKLLCSLKYENDKPMVQIYERGSLKEQGSIVAFGLLSPEGKGLGYYSFMTYSNLKGIHLRAGSNCNIGSTQYYTDIQDSDISVLMKNGHKCGGKIDMFNGKPTGVLRASFGAMSTMADVRALMSVIKEYLLGNSIKGSGGGTCKIEELWIYPVKSLPGVKVDQWKVENGFVGDRKYVIIRNGKVVTLKNCPKMATLQLELIDGGLLIRHEEDIITVPIDCNDEIDSKRDGKFYVFEDSKICQFFERHLGAGYQLAWTGESNQNKSDFLVINQASFDAVCDDKFLMHRFRGNIIVSHLNEFAEDQWNGLIGNVGLKKVSDCERCKMITVDSKGGWDRKFYFDIAKKRKWDGKVWFGINMDATSHGLLSVGDIFTII